ncbi:hypothetical protein [Bradyrhizobium brasilense]|uniref:hypothetical protein n=1 Tax=Bradyrhizobium brasilense TaxID=1419277 RepID=UPI001E285C2F|nr:hypothetical protein [Bradyrhizobium brasilense]MCC8976347.1 hypothetical protein [Bradyrhizobium brasilense]
MALQSLPGARSLLGPLPYVVPSVGFNANFMTGNGNETYIIGRMRTSDGNSHTIDTTGSSAIGWRNIGCVFSSGTTVLNVGLAAVDTTNGSPGRPVNSGGTTTFDVVCAHTTAGTKPGNNAWTASVPTTGSKTIADGDLVAFAVQYSALGGSDFCQVAYGRAAGNNSVLFPFVGTYQGSFSGVQGSVPGIIVVFNDGAIGYFDASDVVSVYNNQNWNNTSGTKEFGQLYQMPFPMKVCGMYAYMSGSGDLNFNLYSDPLGTPVAQVSHAYTNKISVTTGNPAWLYDYFPTPYNVAANQPIGAVIQPSTSTNVQLYYKTIANAAHRAADPWGTSGYGISRSSGAFANTNSSLDHYYVGLLVSAFDDAAGGGGGGGSGSGYVIGS